MGRKQKTIATRDHKPECKEETKRIVAAGSFVKNNRVGGRLAMSRAMGDFDLKKSKMFPYDPIDGAVCAVPTILVGLVPITGGLLIVACDGIFDVMSNKQAMDFVEDHLNRFPRKNVATALVRHADKRGSTDNMTCIVVRIRR
jgi:serine/threonine protein phosphatase PrpC